MERWVAWLQGGGEDRSRGGCGKIERVPSAKGRCRGPDLWAASTAPRPSSPTHPPPAVRVEARPGKGRAKHSALWELLAGVMEPSREKKTEGRAVPRPIVGARA